MPHFNPDLEESLPDAVLRLRRVVGSADALLISCPEYARGIPGSFKNVLDWLVSDTEFPGKPVALINTSARAHHAQAALRLILETMSARLILAASITIDLLGRQWTPEELVAEPRVVEPLRSALSALAAAILLPAA